MARDINLVVNSIPEVNIPGPAYYSVFLTEVLTNRLYNSFTVEQIARLRNNETIEASAMDKRQLDLISKMNINVKFLPMKLHWEKYEKLLTSYVNSYLVLKKLPAPSKEYSLILMRPFSSARELSALERGRLSGENQNFNSDVFSKLLITKEAGVGLNRVGATSSKNSQQEKLEEFDIKTVEQVANELKLISHQTLEVENCIKKRKVILLLRKIHDEKSLQAIADLFDWQLLKKNEKTLLHRKAPVFPRVNISTDFAEIRRAIPVDLRAYSNCSNSIDELCAFINIEPDAYGRTRIDLSREKLNRKLALLFDEILVFIPIVLSRQFHN